MSLLVIKDFEVVGICKNTTQARAIIEHIKQVDCETPHEFFIKKCVLNREVMLRGAK